jgi:hypothetical protein
MRADHWTYADAPLRPGVEWNEMTCAGAIPLFRAMLDTSQVVRMSIPGPFGLPGGYPVCIEHGKLTLDLPSSHSQADAVAFQRIAAREDGIDSIADDGTITLTRTASEILAKIDPELAEPLHPSQALGRFRRLQSFL